MDVQALIAKLPQPVYLPCHGPHYPTTWPTWTYRPQPWPTITYTTVRPDLTYTVVNTTGSIDTTKALSVIENTTAGRT